MLRKARDSGTQIDNRSLSESSVAANLWADFTLQRR